MIDAVFIIFMVCFFIKGLLVGDTRELLGVFAMGVSCLVSIIPANGIIRDLVAAGFPREIGHVVGYGISSFFAFPFVYLLTDFLTRSFQYFGDRLNPAKRILGALFSSLKGLLVLVLLSTVLTQLPLISITLNQSRLVKILRLY